MRPLGAILLLAVLAFPATAAADRDFQRRYGETVQGDIRLFGNKLTDCADATAGCAGARAGTTTLFNNDISMVHVDVDGDASTFNSSRAGFALPPGATVRFAGLYWGAAMASEQAGLFTPPPDKTARGTVRLDPPGAGGYQTITADVLDDPFPGTEDYGGFADVTGIVAAAGSGTYTVADVQSSTGRDAFAGWALVVAFADDSEPLRNLTVFDGWKLLFNNSVTQTVSGFRTPAAPADVRTRMGAVSHEGEGFNAGENQMIVEGTAIGDALNPTGDVFNGTITALGAHLTDKTPNHVYQLSGVEIDLIATTNVLGNGISEADVGFTSGTQDGYFPHALTFATEVEQPLLELAQTVTDVDGGTLRAGDVVEFTVTVTNSGNDDAEEVVLTDTLPAGVPVVDGSVEPSGAQIAAGDLVAQLGTIPAQEVRTVRFRVRVDPAAPVGTVIANAAEADYEIPSSAIALKAAAPPVSATVVAPPPLPSLTLVKTVADLDGGAVRAGDVLEYTIVARNGGDGSAEQVAIADAVPAGTTLTSGTPDVGLGAVPAGAEKSHSFRVVIADATPVGTVIDNVADATYVVPVNGASLTARSNVARVTVAEAKPVAQPLPPAPPVIAAPMAVPPTFAQVVRLPSTRRCVSRRRFRIRLREPKGERIASARVFVNGKRVRVVRGKRLRAPVDLRGLPKGRFTVKIEVRTEAGRTVRGTRRYRTCTPKRRRS